MEETSKNNEIKINRNEIHEYRDIMMECHIPEKNTHKYYHFHIGEKDSTEFSIQYGRIGKKANYLKYKINELWMKFSEKQRKGYRVIRVSRFDELSIAFVDFIDKYFGDIEEDLLPE
jgi:predicted DNA-binding WGR domain protein